MRGRSNPHGLSSEAKSLPTVDNIEPKLWTTICTIAALPIAAETVSYFRDDLLDEFILMARALRGRENRTRKLRNRCCDDP
jgi:hypothetical protein